jgi:putative transcriptional regulator
MTTKAKKPSRLRLEILELAHEMRANETLNETDFRKITLREFTDAAPTAAPLSADDIRALREDAHMSQAVFAKYLNLTAGHLSQMERGLKRPTGPALALLNVIRRKGIEVVL